MTQKMLRKSVIETDFIIFGADNYNSLGVLHALASVGKQAFILAVGSKEIIYRSRYAKHIKYVEDASMGVEWLISSAHLFPVNTIIYPTGDGEEKTLDNNLESLSKHYLFPNCGTSGTVAKLMDKQLQTRLAAKHGIRIIESQYSSDPDFSIENVGYPCMVKPLNSTAGSKSDMKVCHNIDQLKQALSSGRYTDEFIVQRYISNEADLLFLGIALPDGKVVIPTLVKKPGVEATGEYTHAIISTDIDSNLPEKQQVISFVKSLGYVGPFSIEFGLEKGKNYFFEINLRNDGTSHYPLGMGINIPMIYYNSLLGNSPQIPSEKREYLMIDEVADSRRILRKEVTIKEWLTQFLSAGSYRYYAAKDYSLLLPLLSRFLHRLLSKATKFHH